ncbi:potassium channel family protein [Stackebrandtia soli]|uniref:potassium channel family protein n=1 Tax=Stackebrandtia soli TaxID=1892856 RepID=UPI0039E74249
MHVVIMGCGRVGSVLAHSISERGHSVAIIDRNPEAFRRLGADFDGQSITGVGFDKRILTAAGITRAAAFAAVSSGDNSNIIAARVAREVYGVNTVVARIYDSQRAVVYERLGIPTVATVRWTADRMLRHLVPDDQPPLWRDPTSTVSMVEVRYSGEWIGHPLARLERAAGTRVAYLMRFGIGTLPTNSMMIQDGDQLFMLVTEDIVDSVRAVAAGTPEGQGE